MNQTFDLTRFNNYFAYFLKTGIRRHLAIVGALLGFALLMVVLPLVLFHAYEHGYLYDRGDSFFYNDTMSGTMIAVFYLMGIVTMTVSASTMFYDFGDKASRLEALMLPASSLEKFIARWIVFVPLTAVVYIVGFELIEIIRYICVYVIYNDPVSLHFLGGAIFTDLHLDEATAWNFFNLIIALFVLGAIVWPRFSLIKTFAVYILLSTIYGWWGMLMVTGILPEYHAVSGSAQDIILISSNIVVFIVTLAIYVIAYYRLKEIELIQRW